MDNINVNRLTQELISAGIKISGCNANGIVWAEDGTTEIQDRKDVREVIAKHDPTPDPQPEPIEERIKKLESALLETKEELTTVKTQVDELKKTDVKVSK